MRRFCLFALILVSLSLYGQRNYYTKKADKEAIKSAYRIIKTSYPDRTLCVEDSVFDLDWWSSKEYSDDVNKKINGYRPSKNYVFHKPAYEEGLSELLQADSCICGKNCYYVEFSEPYEGMIRCDIVNFDKRLAIFGIIPQFLFIYNDEGEIIQVTKTDFIAN